MQLKGSIQREALCYSCGYLDAMVTTDVLKMGQKRYQREHKHLHNTFWCYILAMTFLSLNFLENEY